MEPRGRPVKPARRYDGRRRRAAAERHRTAVLDAAHVRFLRDGYGPTTVASIAADAGVSVDTVYKGFGGKPGLVTALRERALAGSGDVPAETRSDALPADDPHALVRGWAELLAEVMPLVAPLLLLVRDAAAHDPEMRAVLAELDADRLRRMTANAHRLAGHLRDGVTVAEAADVLWTWSAPELYELVVVRRGWSAGRFARWAGAGMAAALLP